MLVAPLRRAHKAISEVSEIFDFMLETYEIGNRLSGLSFVVLLSYDVGQISWARAFSRSACQQECDREKCPLRTWLRCTSPEPAVLNIGRASYCSGSDRAPAPGMQASPSILITHHRYTFHVIIPVKHLLQPFPLSPVLHILLPNLLRIHFLYLCIWGLFVPFQFHA